MTKEEFILLSFEEQESFINNGGAFSTSVSEFSEVAMQTGEVFVVLPQEVSGFSSSQSAPSLDKVLIGSELNDGLLIADPVDLLYLVDKEIQLGEDDGGVNLHQWQIQFMLDFANKLHNQENPFQAAVRACNGSGKDKYVIAACAVWICMRYKNTVCPVTSSSGFQLDNQTCKHTKRLCEAVNRYFGIELWDCKYRNYTFRFDQNDHEFDSQILCYATDEPGKAEGFHPVGKGKKMAIFCSEDKTIPDEINNAINKCTGYTHRVHASTPGKCYGHFHDYCRMSVNRKSIKSVKDVGSTDWIEYHITSDMCPHLGKNYKEKAAKNIPGGENSSAYKSQVDAEFGTDDGEMVVIPFTYVWQAARNTKKISWIVESHNTAGLDLSDGGAETSLAIRNGNKLIKVIPFKFDNSTDTIDFLVEKFKENELNHEDSTINGDSVGIGKPILDRLKQLGWKNIRYFDSRAKAYNSNVYKNRNSEVWFHFRRLLEQSKIILIQDNILEKQLGSRHYKLKDGKIHQMLSKIEEKNLGHESPDRADSVLYSFWNYRPLFTEEDIPEDSIPFVLKEIENNIKGDFDMRIWAKGNINRKSHHNELNDLDELKEELKESNKRRKLTYAIQ